MKSQVTITLTKDLTDDQAEQTQELLNSPALLEAAKQAYEEAVSYLFGEEQGVKAEVQIDLVRGG